MWSMFENTKLEEAEKINEKKVDEEEVEEQKEKQEQKARKTEESNIPSSKTAGSRTTNTAMNENRETNDKCCSLTVDISSTVCIFIASIFFLVGSVFIMPQVGVYGITSKISYWTLGALFYLGYASIEVYKHKSKGVLAIVMSSLGLLAGVFWFIASVFLFRGRVYRPMPFAVLWFLGSLCNFGVITFYIVKLFLKSGPKPLFLTFALTLSWIANLLYFAGSAHLMAGLNKDNFQQCEDYTMLGDIGGMMLSGSVVYLIHSIFYTLALFLGGISFKVEFSNSSP